MNEYTVFEHVEGETGLDTWTTANGGLHIVLVEADKETRHIFLKKPLDLAMAILRNVHDFEED